MTGSDLLTAIRARPAGSTLLVGDGVSLSTGEVLAGVEAWSATCRGAGLGPCSRLAIVLPNGPALALANLAAAVIGVAAPLDPRSTAAELRSTLGRLRADAVVVDPDDDATAAIAAAAGLGVLHAGAAPDAAPVVARVADRARGGPARSDDSELALLLHSSGTTAEPKLIGLSVANLLASARAVAATLRLGPDDRCLNVMPLFHIHGLVGALLSSVVAGASVHCTPGFDAFAHRRRLADPTITWSTAVPSMYHAVLLRSDRREPNPSLRVLRSSSAPLPAALWRELEAQFGCPVVNAYGMTEASHQMASNPLPPAERRIGTVGRGAGADVAVLVDGVVTDAAGVQGEVVVRGPGVMSGYLAPPAANDGAWADGWFRTGDLGTLDDDGYLTLVGRIKEIVNVAGEKVSPFEVEAAIAEHPEVVDAVAFAVPDPMRGEVVGAAVVAAPGADVASLPESVRRLAGRRLSRAKQPSHVVVVEAIPLGPTGKVQRARLAAMLGIGGDPPPG